MTRLSVYIVVSLSYGVIFDFLKKIYSISTEITQVKFVNAKYWNNNL